MKKIINSAIVDLTYGDSAKGRVANEFSSKYDWVIRTSGANNCGHTIFRDGKKYVHNIVPSFDWRNKEIKAFIGSGTVIDLNHLLKEVSQLYQDCPSAVQRLYLDPDAFTILPEHIEEDKSKNGHIGSTNRGVGPAYKEKVNRTGKKILSFIKDNDNRISELKSMGMKFEYVLSLEQELSKSCLLFESAQGVMIDIDHGTYPFVSCGSAALAGIHSSGFSFSKLDNVFGLTKAYTTRVGNGPLAGEGDNYFNNTVAQVGKEVGATTGRARRVAPISLPELRYASRKAGATSLIVSKLDVLNGFDKIPMISSYSGIDSVVSTSQLEGAIPSIKYANGWKDCSSNANYVDAMSLSEYLEEFEKATDLKVSHISCGINPEDLRRWKY